MGAEFSKTPSTTKMLEEDRQHCMYAFKRMFLKAKDEAKFKELVQKKKYKSLKEQEVLWTKDDHLVGCLAQLAADMSSTKWEDRGFCVTNPTVASVFQDACVALFNQIVESPLNLGSFQTQPWLASADMLKATLMV